jgi:plasmid stabilization system protein ParE
MKYAGKLQLSSKMASKPIEFQEKARADYRAAFDWYFERSHLAAQKFSDELTHAIASIAESPHRWPKNLHNTRNFFFGIFRSQLSIESSLQQFK